MGGLVALSNVDLTVSRNGIAALIGPNGAGKTTMFNLIDSGLDRPNSGSIEIEGQSTAGMPVHSIVRSLRLVRTFQNVRLYSQLTVADNVRIAMHTRSHAGFVMSTLKLPVALREERDITAQAMRWLEFVGMAHRANAPAGTLSYGEQRLVEIGAGPRSRSPMSLAR